MIPEIPPQKPKDQYKYLVCRPTNQYIVQLNDLIQNGWEPVRETAFMKNDAILCLLKKQL